VFADQRYAWIEASTKSGKTHACVVWLHEQAALNGRPGRHFWWVAPSHVQAKIAYSRLCQALPLGTYQRNDTAQSVALLNGATLTFRSGEKPDLLYGEDVWAAVIDEASRVRHEAFVAVRSTLTATQGPIRMIGNVKGKRNWFYRGCRAAEAGLAGHHWARLNAYDAADAGVIRRTEIDDAQRVLPESDFRQLYLALPAEDGDSFFATDRIHVVDAPPPHAKKARGWDFATTDAADADNPDWTAGVLVAYTPELTAIVDVTRIRKAPDGTLNELERCARVDGPTVRVVVEQERGAAGKTMVESIRRHLRQIDGGRRVVDAPVTGDKPTRAFELATTVNSGRLVLVQGPWNDAYLAELDEFPSLDAQVHDDQVDASAHAFNHLADRRPGARLRTIPA
jgi:predicted phage terminase large subunit-like protein